MSAGVMILGFLAAVLFVLTLMRDPAALTPALRDARSNILVVAFRIPLALLSAAFISIMLPPAFVAPYIGPESEYWGIMVATLVGGLLPGGPMLAFPLALVVWRAGAGDAQMVAFLASWSVLALYRTVSYELPILGGKFIIVRLASSWMLPLLTGFIALCLIAVLGTPERP